MPKIIKFKLRKNDFKILQDFIKKGKAKARQYKRAEILLLLHKGVKGVEICNMFGFSSITVIRTRQNYEKHGLDRAIFDLKRSGRPQKFTTHERAKITALACTKAPEGRGRCSLTLLRDTIIQLKFVKSISRAQVARI